MLKNKKFTTTTTAVFTGIILALIASIFLFSLNPAEAVTESQLRAEAESLQAQIDQNQEVLHELAHKKVSLENKLTALRTEIDTLNKQIQLTVVEIDELEIQLDKTEKELNRQKSILKEAVRTLYIEGDVTTLELLLGSENFGEFFDQQEYLETLKLTIQDSAEQVELLKQKLQKEKQEQEDLLDQQQAQKRSIQIKKDEQARLLEQTRGEEARYQNLVADLEQQKQEAERALAEFIASRSFVSLGPVTQGAAIGTVGNTGFSTGPHLHFEVRDSSGAVTDPKPFIYNGWSWPTPGSEWQIWQDYANPSGWYANGYHPGIDTGYSGEKVVAMGSGSIIARGCSSDYLDTPAYGYMVMIDHGNGYTSLYAHMLPPDNPAYSHCSYSYGF